MATNCGGKGLCVGIRRFERDVLALDATVYRDVFLAGHRDGAAVSGHRPGKQLRRLIALDFDVTACDN